MPRKSAAKRAVERRIVDAVRRAVALGYKPKSIYLARVDMREMIRRSDDSVSVDGLPLRLGERSKLYCHTGASVNV